MTTSTIPQFTINGVIDTKDSILSNLEKITTASGAWLTYDINQGKWAVVINTTGSSQASFDDSNIIGGINISSTGLTEVYNSVEVEFPNRDIKDRKDYITLTIPSEDRYPNEPDNKLTMSFDIVNDPLQAELLASRELKQSRIDKIVEFRADYSYIGLKAGDLIDITNEQYGFTNKIFRIIKISEEDGENGEFQLSISALEYDADVYDSTGLIREEKSIESGITSNTNNTSLIASNNAATTASLTSALTDPNNLALVTALLAAFAPKSGSYGFPVLVYDYTDSSTVLLKDPPNGIDDIDFQNLSSIHELKPTGYYINFGPSWIVPYTGIYKFNSFIRFLLGAPTDGPNDEFGNPTGNYSTVPSQLRSQATLKLSINGSDYVQPGNLSANIYTAGGGGPPNIVFNLTGLYTLTKGSVVQFKLCCVDEWGPNNFSAEGASGTYILGNIQAYYAGT